MTIDTPTLLSKANKSLIRTEPFPHLILPDALDTGIYNKLCEQFPSLETITGGAKHVSNQRYSYSASTAFQDKTLTAEWERFLRAHISQKFFTQLCAIFGDVIQRCYPNFEQSLGPLTELRVGLRNKDSFDKADILLDAQVCINTPVTEMPTSVRGPHIDIPNKLFAGLFYLRHPEDDSKGGELELYRFKEKPGGFHDQFISENLVESVEQIPYQNNLLVMFMNSFRSLHGVKIRFPTPHIRCFVNLVAEVRDPLFDLVNLQHREPTKDIPIQSRDGRRLMQPSIIQRLREKIF